MIISERECQEHFWKLLSSVSPLCLGLLEALLLPHVQCMVPWGWMWSTTGLMLVQSWSPECFGVPDQLKALQPSQFESFGMESSLMGGRSASHELFFSEAEFS